MHRQPTDVIAVQGGPGRRQLDFGQKEKYNVVGIFTAGGSAAESEIWADLKDVEKNTGRDGSVSCVQIRAASRGDYDKLTKTIDDDNRFKLAAIPEPLYFETQSRSGIFLKGAGTLIAVLLTFGAMFSAANTMFAAVSSAHPRDRHDACARLLPIRHPRQLPGRVALALRLGGALGLLATFRSTL